MLRGLLLVLPFLLGLWAERAVRRWKPLWLAPFAFVPIARRRRVTLSARLAAEARRREERTYRQPAVGEVDASRLALPDRVGEARVAPEGDLAMVTSPTHSAVARIDVRFDGDTAILSARCLPVPVSLVGWSLLVLLTSRGSPLLLALALGIPLVTGIGAVRRLRPHVAQAMDDMARRLSE